MFLRFLLRISYTGLDDSRKARPGCESVNLRYFYSRTRASQQQPIAMNCSSTNAFPVVIIITFFEYNVDELARVSPVKCKLLLHRRIVRERSCRVESEIAEEQQNSDRART